MKTPAIVLSFVFCSCISHSPGKNLAEIDQIRIYRNNSESIYISKDARAISIFKEALSGEPKKRTGSSCKIARYIWLMKGDETREIASISLVAPDCMNLTINEGETGPYFVYQMTYRAGMFLDNVMYQQTEHVRNN